MSVKYTESGLRDAVEQSYSWADVCRLFGVKESGGIQAHIKGRAIAFGIDFSHFKSRGWSTGKVFRSRRKSPEEILVRRTSGNRTKAVQLRRALIECGIGYFCSKCRISEWEGRELVLEVDHIDGDALNDSLENLRFLCPNCHSQTETYKNRIRKVPGNGP